MLFGSLFPKEEALSAYTVDYERLYAAGYRGLLFDIDNTLVMHGAPATPEAVSLFAHLHRMGFRTCLISNNRKPRVAPFAEAAGFLNKDLVAVVHRHAIHAALLCKQPPSPDLKILRENTHRVETCRSDRVGGCGGHRCVGR